MSRSNAALFGVVIALGGWYYFHDIKGKPAREKSLTQARRFFPAIEKKDVVGVKVEQLKASDKTKPPFAHNILRQNGVWVLQGEDPVVLRTTSLGSAVKTLVELQRADDLSTATPAPRLTDFGLDKPSYRLTLTGKDKQTYSMILGDKTPDDQGYYASTKENGPVYAINSTLPELLESSTDTMRETSPIVFEPSAANKVVWEAAGKPPIEVGLAKPRDKNDDDDTDDGMEITDLNEEWVIRSPEKGPADWAKIRDHVWNWRNVKLGRFMNKSEKVDFSHPTLRMTVHLDGQKEPFVLEIGSAVPAGKPGLYYARRMPPNEQMVLEFTDLKLLEPKLVTFMQRHIFNFQPEDAKRLAATLDGEAVEASRSGESWKVSKPALAKEEAQQLQATAISDLVWEVKNVEWTEQLKSAPKDWKERGSIEVWGAKDSLGKLVLGPAQPGGKGAYVKDGAGKYYLVETDPLNRWQDIKKRVEGKATPTPTPAVPPMVLPGQ